MLNAMFDGFEKGTETKVWQVWLGSLAWYIDNDKMTQENAVSIMTGSEGMSGPPIDTNEVVTIWNSIMSKP